MTKAVNCEYLDCARTPITSAYKSATMLMLAAFGFGALLIYTHTTHTIIMIIMMIIIIIIIIIIIT